MSHQSVVVSNMNSGNSIDSGVTGSVSTGANFEDSTMSSFSFEEQIVSKADSESINSYFGESTNSMDEQIIRKLLPMELPSKIKLVNDIKSFMEQGLNPKGPYNTGISISPYYNITIKSTIVPVYCVPVTFGGPHHFAMMDVTADQFPLDVVINASSEIASAKILPERYGILPEVQIDQVEFQIEKYGKYTMVLNGSHENPVTVIVRENKKVPQQDGYQVITYKKGIHYVDFIDIKSNTILYLESGALLIPRQPNYDELPIKDPDWAGKKKYRPFILMKDAFNVKIIGNGVIDFTSLDWHMRVPIEIMNCKNVEIEGVTLINAPEWNLTSWYSQNVNIKDVVIFGYRQNSDGIEIVNSQDVVVEDCFIRSGDDLYGVKSMNTNALVGGKNIYFNNCIAWPDKVRGFGILHETVSDINNVHFTGCSVLYKFSNWMDELGSLAVIAAGKGTISQIYFKDIEIFYEIKYPIICSFIKDEGTSGTGASIGTIRNIYFENIRYNGDLQIRLKGQENREKLDYIYFKDIYKSGKKVNTIEELNLYKNELVGDHILLD
ncbi:MAG: glycosyl hydrolase family 28 protein [Saccharofermentanales bacterium]